MISTGDIKPALFCPGDGTCGSTGCRCDVKNERKDNSGYKYPFTREELKEMHKSLNAGGRETMQVFKIEIPL